MAARREPRPRASGRLPGWGSCQLRLVGDARRRGLLPWRRSPCERGRALYQSGRPCPDKAASPCDAASRRGAAPRAPLMPPSCQGACRPAPGGPETRRAGGPRGPAEPNAVADSAADLPTRISVTNASDVPCRHRDVPRAVRPASRRGSQGAGREQRASPSGRVPLEAYRHGDAPRASAATIARTVMPIPRASGVALGSAPGVPLGGVSA